MDEMDRFKKELDKISPTFCVAKWKQVTVHLESGLTHSCHHPGAHLIPLDELKNNVTALHNTKHKKSLRKLMLEGKTVEECEYCNRTERGLKNNISDRVYKSHEKWALDQIPEIISNPWDYDVFPTYLEVSFTGNCNCKCMYCSSTYSSSWVKEIEKDGAYPVSEYNKDFDNDPQPLFMDNSKNPYMEAFWKWWPDLYNKLRVFRITGGEPLLDKNTFEILDFVINNIKPDLILDINSNLSISPKIFDRFIEKVKLITTRKMKFGLYTSCESKGKQTDYIRYGMNYDKWLENCWKYLQEVPFGELIIMSTFNILSITSFKDFLIDMLKLKKEFPLRVFVDIPFLMNPPYLQANIITKDFLPYIEECVTYMYNNLIIPGWPPLSRNGFYYHEASKLKRIYYMVKEKSENKDCIKNRKDFYLFINEYDKRRETNFLETFPEYETFYNECKNIGVPKKLIFGYDKFQEDGKPITNAFEADIKNNVSPVNLGWAGYEMPTEIIDSEVRKRTKKSKLCFPTYYNQFSNWFDIEIKKVATIKEKYYYIIDVFPEDFWQSPKSSYPKISDKTINDIKNRKSKILVLFCNEAMNPTNENVSVIFNTWAATYDLPPRSIVLNSGNFSYGDILRENKYVKYIPYSIWENNIRHHYYPKSLKIFEKFIIDKRKRPKVYLCYNRRARSQRIELVHKLKEYGIIEKGFVSLGKDFNNKENSHIPIDFLNSLPITFDNTDLSVNQAGTHIPRDFINSYISIVTETWTDTDKIFPTEKIFKPIISLHPFLVLASPGFLKQLENFGYKTFSDWFDQSYDIEMNLNLRIEKIVKEIKRLCSLSEEQLQNMLIEMLPILKHNVNIFIERTSNKMFQKQLEEELWK